MHLSLKKLTSKQVFMILIAVVLILLVIRYTRASTTTSPVVPQKPYTQPTIAPSTPISISPLVSPSSTSLSPADASIKYALLNQILHGQNQSGVVYKTANVEIEYVATDTIFQAQILTPQISDAKSDAENWFMSQGFSQAGECQLLIFYLNPLIKEQLPPEEAQVNLLPDGC